MNNDEDDKIEAVAVQGVRKAAGELIVKALTPAADEIGKGLVTVARAVNIGLAPLSAVVWGYDQICDYVERAVTRKLKNTDAKNIEPPVINVAGPAIEAMRFTANEDNIKDLFAGLIATAMNSQVKVNAHPAFVEIIKQLSSDEAIILRTIHLAGEYPDVVQESYSVVDGNDDGDYHISVAFKKYCLKMNLEYPDLMEAYFDNLLRLRIIEIRKNSAPIVEEKENIWNEKILSIDTSAYVTASVTRFGEKFMAACVYTE